MYDPIPQLQLNGITIAEMYAGGGLMATGFKAAGFDLVWANDFEKTAVTSYRHNIGEHIVLGDITQIDPADIPKTRGIIGGPPCQDFSVAGEGLGEHGERGKLVWDYLHKISVLQPEFFLFENVKGLISNAHKHTFNKLVQKFTEAGYNISWKLLNAWDWGVAQKRERVFIVGIRNDLGFTYQFPEPKPEDYRTKVLQDVIGDLPEPRRGVFYANHTATDYWYPKSEYEYGQANRVQSMDQPSNTIPAHHNNGQPIHPLRAPARFTVREALRIQSIPDYYVIPDTVKLGAAYRIVGNGVPAKLAYELATSLAQQITQYDEVVRANKEAASS